jgi:peptidoglycan/LPS O-acetylase OafA/YrhL
MAPTRLVLLLLGIALELVAIVLISTGSRTPLGLTLLVVGLIVVILAFVAGRHRPSGR